MRVIVLAVPALMMLFAIAPAEAARRSEQVAARQTAARTQAARPFATIATPRGRVLRAAPAAPARNGRAVAGGPSRQSFACIGGAAGRRGAARCGATRIAWQGGLTPAAGVQTADCPEGTMATLATGHTQVVRCMPI